MVAPMTLDFWDHHGFLFLIFITFLPRLTLLFSSVPFGGLFWWLGFIFAPRVLVAFLATITYGASNPILVTISWIVALSGESCEKYFVKRRVNYVRYGRNQSASSKATRATDVIDTHFERIE